MELNLILPPLLGIFGLVVALLLFALVMKYDGGTDEVKKIGDQIHLGAMVFMRREYSCLLYTSPSPRDVEESRMPSSA